MVVGPEAGNPTDAPELHLLAPPLGRLPVDLSAIPSVDLAIQSLGQCSVLRGELHGLLSPQTL